MSAVIQRNKRGGGSMLIAQYLAVLFVATRGNGKNIATTVCAQT